MDIFYNRTYKVFRKLENLFLILFMTVAFLHFCSLTYGKIIISVFQFPTIALGGIIILYRLIFIKNYLNTPVIWLLLSFIASYVISMFANIKYGFYENFRGLVFLIFQICILFAFDIKITKEELNKRYKMIQFYFITVAGILSALSLIFMFTGVSEVYEDAAGQSVIVGFVWGRLFGAHWDPNFASAMVVAAIVLSVNMFINTKNKLYRVLLVLNCILQLLYITFSDSRTGKTTLCIAITVYAAFMLFKNGFKNFGKKPARIVCCVVMTVVVLLVSMILPLAIKEGYNKGTQYIYETFYGSSEDMDKLFPNIASDGREENVSSDISNRRFDIWGSAIELFKESSIVGVSHFNIVPFAQENIPETYILTNDSGIFYGMHNTVFDVLASQGIVGIATFLGSAVCMLIFIIKRRKFFGDKYEFSINAAMFSVMTACFTAAMFINEIVYMISPLALMFWISGGTLVANLRLTSVEPVTPEK